VSRKNLWPVIGLAAIAVGAILVFVLRPPPGVQAVEPPDRITLRGPVRDFLSTHPDFDVTDLAAMGHCVRNTDGDLGASGRPSYTGAGTRVGTQWRDKGSNPIRPYATDPGLPGGHFDVDVFDEPTKRELYHCHEYDDKFDVTYVDIAHDARLLWDEVIGADYPHDLRMTFLNPHHGSGSYVFEADGVVHTGQTQDGFEIIFDPGEMTQCRINFSSLLDLRGTRPSVVQDDVPDRDDSLSIRMVDVTTGKLVYELAVYHHIGGHDGGGGGGGTFDGQDFCGGAIHDTLGTYNGSCPGAVTSASTFDEWYRDIMGTNLSRVLPITLHRTNGVYEYLTDDFYPIDGQLLGNEGEEHNSFFTYTFSATFTYDKCAGQFFEFRGNDDAWVFIDRHMAIDLGGVATPERQYVALDRLPLQDGQQYTLDFFYAHRRSANDSVFRMRTNIVLSTGTVPVSAGYD
jgi:fibro-slime domain-containing protein